MKKVVVHEFPFHEFSDFFAVVQRWLKTDKGSFASQYSQGKFELTQTVNGSFTSDFKIVARFDEETYLIWKLRFE